jgi:hypothetical protein
MFALRGAMPARLINPVVGRMPTIPQKAAGERTDVKVSVPTASAVRSAATAAADPLLDPPGVRLKWYGFRCGPSIVL